MSRKLVPLVSLLLAAALPGCNHFLAERMVAPPNGGLGNPATAQKFATPDERVLSITVGPPRAELAVWVSEPKTAPRGTILFLHGIIANHDWMELPARALRDAGYRTVMVDLRGHGQSTGDHITYGVVEARDMIQVTDRLQALGLAGPDIGVYGCSYGAATAIMYAAADRRVRTVVAIAPFATLAEEAPHFGKALLPIPGAFLSPADYQAILGDAGQIAGFDAADASPLAAIPQTHVPILLIHGQWDAVTSVNDSQRLHDAAPTNTQIKTIAAQGHMGLSLGVDADAMAATRQWFDAHM